MSKKFLVNIDMGGNQIINPIVNGGTLYATTLGGGSTTDSANLVKIQNLSTVSATNAAVGMIAYDTTAQALKVYTNSGWTAVGAGVQTLNSLSGTLTIAGTSNQIAVNAASSTITLSLPTDVTLPGKTTLTASTTSKAALNIPTGVAPTSPAQGDVWNASDVLYYRNASATKTIAYTDSTLTGTWNGSVIAPQYGGTGVANNSANTITFTGNFSLGLTLSGNTSVTLPTSGTLVNSAVTTLSSLASIGTITTGTWQGSIIASAYGGTGNGFTKFSGPTTSEKTFTLPDASATILTSNAAVTLAQGGTNASLTAANGGVIYSTASALAVSAVGTSGYLLKSNGAAAPTWVDPGTLTVSAASTATSATNATNIGVTDDSAATTGYLAWVGATSGNTNAKITSTKLTFNASTGNLSSTTFNKVTITAPATGSTLTIADGKTATVNNSITFAGTDSTTMTFPGTSQTIVGLTATQTLTNKTLTSPTINGATMTGTITVPTPVNGTDAANKTYVDNAVQGLDWKEQVHLLAASNVALTGTSGTLVIDGHTALSSSNDGYRILLKGQTTGSQNGIYIYSDAGAGYTLTRAADADVYTELIGATVYVMEGTTYGTTSWVQSNHYITDFSSQNWVQLSGAGAYTAGDGLTQSGTTFNVGTASSARIVVNADNIDLATVSVGTTGSGSASGSIVQAITTDSYGRVTNVQSGTHTLAAADGSTKGIAAFSSTGFSATSGVVSFASGTTSQTDANVSGGAYTYATQKQSAQINGDGTNNSFVVKHNFGNTNYISVQVIEVTSSQEVEVDITRGNGQVTIAFATAPVLNKKYDVVIVG